MAKKSKEKQSPRDLLNDSDLKDQNVKVRITQWIDMDVMKAAMALANQRSGRTDGKGYQTVINETLRKALVGVPAATVATQFHPGDFVTILQQLQAEVAELKAKAASQGTKRRAS